jgi:ATP phosphoribosyltransferase regulatory subunit
MSALYRQGIKVDGCEETMVIEYTPDNFEESLKKAEKLRLEGKDVVLKAL